MRQPFNYGIVARQLCPYCREKLNAARDLEGTEAMPIENDCTVCGHCGGFLTFDKGLRANKLSLEAWNGLDLDLQVLLTESSMSITRGNVDPS